MNLLEFVAGVLIAVWIGGLIMHLSTGIINILFAIALILLLSKIFKRTYR